MSNDERIGRLLQAIEGLTDAAGEKERTKIIPNCRVVDSNPSGLTGYIIVENELGYYVPAVKSPDLSYVDDDYVNLLIIKGTEPIAFQHGSGSPTGGYPGALPLTTKGDIVTRDASQNIRLGVGSDGLALVADSSETSGLKYGLPGLRVKNTSGAAAVAGDVGYIDYLGEYKTTTTASDIQNWAVVDIGGANNAVISVINSGKRTVAYTGSAPAQGDYLVTSTSAGDAQAQSYVTPAIFAVCSAAGSGGFVEALLLCKRIEHSRFSAADVFRIDTASDSDFVATINGAPSGATVVYNAPSSGDERSIDPSAGTELAKIVLHNTTRGDSALIDSVDTGTNTITLTANAPGTWQSGDTITARSQTNTSTIGAGEYFFDWDLSSSDNTDVPLLAVSILHTCVPVDAGGATITMHPYETNSTPKRYGAIQSARPILVTPLINQRFCIALTASGSGTLLALGRLVGIILASP